MDIQQIRLPGVGVRHEFTLRDGRRVAVIARRDGRRVLVAYATDDPDAGYELISLRADEAATLADLLGADRFVEGLSGLRRSVHGLVTELIEIVIGSPYCDRPFGDSSLRARTGAHAVAILRDGQVLTAPAPEDVLRPGDQLVVVGIADGVAEATRVLEDG